MTEEPNHTDRFRQLNVQFYSSRPSTYFRDRLALLTLRAQRSDGLAELLSEIEWGEPDLYADQDAQADEADVTSFVVTESQVLLHHASEALIRMFLAHAGRPSCPWLETAALLNFRIFRRHVVELAAQAWPPSTVGDVADVFLGGSPDKPNEEWQEALDATVQFIRLLARRLDADKNLYNSAKHGLSVIAGEGSLNILSDDGRHVMGSTGTQIVYLEREETSKTEFTWYEKSKWLNPAQALLLTRMTVTQIDTLWQVARARYLGETYEGLHIITKAALDTALTGFPNPGGITSFRLKIGTEPR